MDTPQEILRNKIEHLRRAHAIEADPNARFKIEQDIKTAERELAGLRPQTRRRRRMLVMAILLVLLAGLAIAYYSSRTRQPELAQPPDGPEAQIAASATPTPGYDNITSLTPRMNTNTATTEGDQSPAIVGDDATVNY
jgi:hypothetical protein